jgi:hypothetical protein
MGRKPSREPPGAEDWRIRFGTTLANYSISTGAKRTIRKDSGYPPDSIACLMTQVWASGARQHRRKAPMFRGGEGARGRPGDTAHGDTAHGDTATRRTATRRHGDTATRRTATRRLNDSGDSPFCRKIAQFVLIVLLHAFTEVWRDETNQETVRTRCRYCG